MQVIQSDDINSSVKPCDFDLGNLIVKNSTNKFGKKKLAVVVPFKNCYEELITFGPHMTAFLNEQKIPFHIFVVNQVDQFRFNRASLINVGFLYTKNYFDYIVMHDIDLLPLNQNLNYGYPFNGVFHVTASYLHPSVFYVSKTETLLLDCAIFIKKNLGILSWWSFDHYKRRF